MWASLGPCRAAGIDGYSWANKPSSFLQRFMNPGGVLFAYFDRMANMTPQRRKVSASRTVKWKTTMGCPSVGLGDRQHSREDLCLPFVPMTVKTDITSSSLAECYKSQGSEDLWGHNISCQPLPMLRPRRACTANSKGKCLLCEQQHLPLTRNVAGAVFRKPVDITFWEETFSQYIWCGK